jgi:hypothetical protein
MAKRRKAGPAKTTIELPAPLHRKLRVKAAVEDRTINDIMVDCVQQCVGNFNLDPGTLDVETVSPDHGGSS